MKDDNIIYAEDISFLDVEKECIQKHHSKERQMEIINMVYRILEKLKIPERNKVIFYEYFRYGNSVSEIAERHNISKQRVSAILKLVAKKIRNKIT